MTRENQTSDKSSITFYLTNKFQIFKNIFKTGVKRAFKTTFHDICFSLKRMNKLSTQNQLFYQLF